MGNCCLKMPIQEPNKPVIVVHISSTGVVRASVSDQLKQLSKTEKTSPNRQHVPWSLLNPPSETNKEKRYTHDRRPPRPTNSNVSSNTHIGGSETKNKISLKQNNMNDFRLRRFGYKVLRDATNNFSKKNFIGEGGFGNVYKGYITYFTAEAAKSNEGFAIAVKRLIPRRSDGYESWKTEVNMLSKLNHPNIVQLVGYCQEDGHKMVVYEYMAQGSLDCCLFRDGGRKQLNWRRRVNIAIGAAKGLAYLHTHVKTIIHRDIKASNVLLDSKFNAKISDFGLAKCGPEDENGHISTKVIGTKGYIAPEYFQTGHLTVKADLYSFGVVLLEILTGSSVDKRCSKGVAGDLVHRSKPFLSRHAEPEVLRRIIDARLRRNVPMEEAHRFAEVTNRCLSLDPKDRPTMDEVVGVLEKLQPEPHDHHNGSRVGRFKRGSMRTKELVS